VENPDRRALQDPCFARLCGPPTRPHRVDQFIRGSTNGANQVERTADVALCREQVVRALALAQELAAFADRPSLCNHYACALLNRVALEAAAEMRRAAARAGLKLAGEQLVQPPVPQRVAEKQDAKEGSDEVSSTPAK
jgi:hypothetical protein